MKPVPDTLSNQLLVSWRIHHSIMAGLLAAIPTQGLQSIPAESRGRTVAEQFRHIIRVRTVWLAYHQTGNRIKMPRTEKGKPIPAAELRKNLANSGKDVEAYLRKCFEEGGRIRMFGRSPVRWMAYLISHESHHRGSIMLALKQNGVKLPKDTAIRTVWEPWFWNRSI